MLAGWWHANWWPDDWWQEDWWQDYGIPVDLYNTIIALDIEEYNGMKIKGREYITQKITVEDSV